MGDVKKEYRMEEVSRTTTLTADQAIRLARAVKGCSEKRMPYIRSILNAAGIEIPSKEEIDRILAEQRDPWKRRNNRVQSKEKWKDTDDELALALRKAYDMKISFTELSYKTGVGRTTLYKYMWDERKPVRETREIIFSKLNELFTERESKAS